MIFRRVDELAPGDAVRPFDDRLWHVSSINPVPDTRGRVTVAAGRITVAFAHPVDGIVEVVACLSDMVRLG